VSTNTVTVQRNQRTVTVSRGAATPISVYRQNARSIQLAQARGPTGATGAAGVSANILYGAGVPPAATGRDGDTYVDTVLGNYYRKDGGAWALQVNLTGYPGWSPVFAVVADSQRAVFQLVDWVTGTGTVNKPPILSGGNPQYLSTAGLTTTIASAFDVRGFAGWTPVYAVATNGNARVLQLSSYVGGTGTAPSVLSGGNPQYLSASGLTTTIGSATDIRGPIGTDGWEPVYANVADGYRIVQQLVDWSGGGGTKPSVPATTYISATGLTTVIANAVDIRGSAGSATGLAIRYKFSTSIAAADPGNGFVTLNTSSQSSATVAHLDLLDTAGVNVATALTALNTPTSTLKGYLRLVHELDPSKWLLWSVSAYTAQSGYVDATLTIVGASTASPFANNDPVVLSFDAKGDKGDTGWAPTFAVFTDTSVSPSRSVLQLTAYVGGTGTARPSSQAASPNMSAQPASPRRLPAPSTFAEPPARRIRTRSPTSSL
jgi:hypothetical protein